MSANPALALDRTLTIEQSVSPEGTLTLVCRGRITLETASHFRSEVKNLASQHKLLLVDLSAVHFVDSAGLGVIVNTYISSKRRGCDLTLVNVHPRIEDLLNITNLTSYLKGENAQSLPKASIWG
jgi:anti-anti-sigma factor